MSAIAKKIAIPIDFDLTSGKLSIRGSEAMSYQESLATLRKLDPNDDALESVFLHAKRNDKVVLAIGAFNGGENVTSPLSYLKIGIKEFEPETLISLNDEDGDDFTTVTIGGQTRHLVVADLTPDTVSNILSSYEEDEGTYVYCPFEVEMTFDAGAVVSEEEQFEIFTIESAHNETEQFSFESLADGDYKLTVKLEHTGGNMPSSYYYPSQEITVVKEFTLTSGSPYVISGESGSLSGDGATPGEGQFQTSLVGALAADNDGFDLDMDVDATTQAAWMVECYLPPGWDTAGSLNWRNYSGWVNDAQYEIFDGAVSQGVVYPAAGTGNGTDTAGGTGELADILESMLTLASTPGGSTGGPYRFRLIFGADPGFTKIVMSHGPYETSPSNSYPAASSDHDLVYYPSGLSMGSKLTATLEQTSGTLPSGPLFEDLPRTSQTAIMRLERDLQP